VSVFYVDEPTSLHVSQTRLNVSCMLMPLSLLVITMQLFSGIIYTKNFVNVLIFAGTFSYDYLEKKFICLF